MKVERILYRLRFFVSAKVSSHLQIPIMAANFVTGVIFFQLNVENLATSFYVYLILQSVDHRVG